MTKFIYLAFLVSLMIVSTNCTFKFLYRTSAYNTPDPMVGGEHTDYLTLD